jgi:hypothetical protein
MLLLVFDHINLPIKIVQRPSEALKVVTDILETKEYIKPIMLEFANLNSWKARYSFLLEKLQVTTK